VSTTIDVPLPGGPTPAAAGPTPGAAAGPGGGGAVVSLAQQFVQALATREPALEAKTKFNLGNCAYSQALQNQDNLQPFRGSLIIFSRNF